MYARSDRVVSLEKGGGRETRSSSRDLRRGIWVGWRLRQVDEGGVRMRHVEDGVSGDRYAGEDLVVAVSGEDDGEAFRRW